ncbi:hypothetical protein D3C73_1368880 [compost metagenome]
MTGRKPGTSANGFSASNANNAALNSSGRPCASSNRLGCGSWPSIGEPRSMPLTLLNSVVNKSRTQPSQSRLTPSHTSTSSNPA